MLSSVGICPGSCDVCVHGRVDPFETMAWAADYAANVATIVHRHGGEYLAVSKGTANAVHHVEGVGVVPDAVVLFRFPSLAAAQAFLDAPDYQPYKQARVSGTTGDIFAFENDDDAPQFVGQERAR